MTAPATATLLALQEFHDFARLWVPTAVRDQVWDDRRNPVTSIVKAIKAITPPEPTVGWGVYSRVYEPENKSRMEHVQVSLVFEDLVQAQNAFDYCMAKQRDDFVICGLREIPR